MLCPSCQRSIPDNSPFCPVCGHRVSRSVPPTAPAPSESCATPSAAPSSSTSSHGPDRPAFSGGGMTGLVILSFLVPIVGWIVGGTNLKYPARKSQAGLLTGVATVAFFAYFLGGLQ